MGAQVFSIVEDDQRLILSLDRTPAKKQFLQVSAGCGVACLLCLLCLYWLPAVLMGPRIMLFSVALGCLLPASFIYALGGLIWPRIRHVLDVDRSSGCIILDGRMPVPVSEIQEVHMTRVFIKHTSLLMALRWKNGANTFIVSDDGIIGTDISEMRRAAEAISEYTGARVITDDRRPDLVKDMKP